MSHSKLWIERADLFCQKIRELQKIHRSQNWWPCLVSPERQNTRAPEHLFKNRAFEVTLGAILTQNTAWKNVEKALACLTEKRLTDPTAILNANMRTLESCVHASGYYKQKARKLRTLAKFIIDECGGDLSKLQKDERAREKLLGIWGVGPETADTILLYGLDLPYFVVDTYTRRLLCSLTGSEHWKNCSYDEVQKFCAHAIPKSVASWQEAHAVIVEWGKML
jgi:endonuclease-3 related protein